MQQCIEERGLVKGEEESDKSEVMMMILAVAAGLLCLFIEWPRISGGAV